MKLDRAVLATFVAITVAGVLQIFTAFAVERDETEAVGNELVREDGGIRGYVNEIDGKGGYFGEHDPAEGIGHG